MVDCINDKSLVLRLWHYTRVLQSDVSKVCMRLLFLIIACESIIISIKLPIETKAIANLQDGVYEHFHYSISGFEGI